MPFVTKMIFVLYIGGARRIRFFLRERELGWNFFHARWTDFLKSGMTLLFGTLRGKMSFNRLEFLIKHLRPVPTSAI